MEKKGNLWERLHNKESVTDALVENQWESIEVSYRQALVEAKKALAVAKANVLRFSDPRNYSIGELMKARAEVKFTEQQIEDFKSLYKEEFDQELN